jgi:hypothetical protein
MNASVGCAGELSKGELGLEHLAKAGLKGLNRYPRSDLTGLGATHPIGYYKQRRAREQRILVRAPLASSVGPGVLLGYTQHLSRPRR